MSQDQRNFREDSDQGRWLADFQRRHGRPLRMLHIGNIANNAYRNARLMRRLGIDCDVLCYNYYHVMGCPEWDDADFRGTIDDHFLPDWRLVSLGGFERPRWFAQGPFRLCVRYLEARQSGRRSLAARYWRQLCLANRTPRPETVGEERHGARPSSPPDPGALARRLQRSRSWAEANLRRQVGRLRRLGRSFRDSLGMGVPVLEEDLVRRHASLQDTFRQVFEERKDPLRDRDFMPYLAALPLWRRLFKNYDLIQGYSTDPIWPLLTGVPYFAFEHGTLREIPFQADGRGRLTALAYHLAEHVFVTNADCMENARLLAGDRVTFINHPYDEDHGIHVEGVAERRAELISEFDCDHLFLFPTRHDWVEGTGFADKSNDVFLRAYARLREKGHRIGLICCRWGSNVEQSMQLLRELGCGDSVGWVEPMGVVEFDRTIRACDLVADQFKLGAFGGVTLTALSNATPVCSRLDVQALGRLYEQPPPLVNCQNEDEIVSELDRLLNRPEALDELGRLSRIWINRYHGARMTVERQVRQYRRFLEQRDAEVTGRTVAETGS